VVLANEPQKALECEPLVLDSSVVLANALLLEYELLVPDSLVAQGSELQKTLECEPLVPDSLVVLANEA
jgi:hypothetical protein